MNITLGRLFFTVVMIGQLHAAEKENQNVIDEIKKLQKFAQQLRLINSDQPANMNSVHKLTSYQHSMARIILQLPLSSSSIRTINTFLGWVTTNVYRLQDYDNCKKELQAMNLEFFEGYRDFLKEFPKDGSPVRLTFGK